MGNAFMGQNIPPTQAGVVVQPQPITTVPATTPAETGGLFSGIDKQKGLGIAAVLAKLAEGYDKSIGGTGAMGSAVSDLAQSGLVAQQQKKPELTPKGSKGTTTRTIVEGPNGERTVTEKSNDYDQVGGGAQPAPQGVGNAFAGGGQGLPPFESPAGLEFIDVGTQLKLAELQQDPVGSVVTGDDGMQYGLTRSGNMIPLNVGTQKKAPKPQRDIVSTKEGQTLIDLISGKPVAEFGPAPTTDKATQQRLYTTKEGQRRAFEIDASGKEVPGTDRAYDWKPSEGGAGGAKGATNFLEIEKRRQDLKNVRDDKGFLVGGTQLKTHIRAANADLKKANAPYRYEYIKVPRIDPSGIGDFEAKDMVITTEVDKKGKPNPITIGQFVNNLVTDYDMSDKDARENALLYFMSQGALDKDTIKKARKEFSSVNAMYKRMNKKKR